MYQNDTVSRVKMTHIGIYEDIYRITIMGKYSKFNMKI
jgi:hypothetical protein